MHPDEVPVDAALVRLLLEEQLPHLGDLPLRRVEPWGTDNAIWRLGEEYVVRLPRIHWAVAQIELEARWLPKLGPLLPVEVPEPVAVGESGSAYPFPWAVHRWLPGVGAGPDTLGDPLRFALDLAEVVRALWSIPTQDAPAARNRARPLRDYDAETRAVISASAHRIDGERAFELWAAALDAAPHTGPRRWVHGDLDGNLLVRDGRLTGLVDWGSACAGDPAVDIQVVWSPLFTPESRRAFIDALAIDESALARSIGTLLHQSCSAIFYYSETFPLIMERSWHKLAAVGVGRR